MQVLYYDAELEMMMRKIDARCKILLTMMLLGWHSFINVA